MAAHRAYVSTIDADSLEEGIMFDGSSIAGWKAINESDMCLKPDLETAVMDPFAAQPLLILFCDVLEPTTGQLTNAIRGHWQNGPKAISSRLVSAIQPISARKQVFRL